jgi:hypothetical protein
MRSSNRIRTGGATLLLIGFAFPACALDLFCPRAGVLLSSPAADNPSSGAVLTFTASRGDPNALPNNINALASRADDTYPISLKLVDCSTREFQCKVATFATGPGNPQEFLLVLPRELSPGKEYTFRGVRMVTRISNYSSPRNVAAAQVTLWQRIGDVTMPMELTVQPGRGVLFWDGVKFFPVQDGPGEACALTSENGFFRGTRVLLH